MAAVALLALTVPAMAGRVLVTPLTTDHGCVFQAYCGSSGCGGTGSNGTDKEFGPANPLDVIKAVPGVLSIVPGTNWANFVKASNVSSLAGKWYIKNVTLKKQTPELGQCNDVFPAHSVIQQGTPNIRLWWPLMFEVPGTTFTLTITYGTTVAFDDDGPGPNPASYVHTEIHIWKVCADLDSMINLVNLFHEIPFGTDEVPLISNEDLFPILLGYLVDAKNATDLSVIGALLVTFESEVSDNCIPVSPPKPNPNGPDTGVAGGPLFGDKRPQDQCYPACCKLIVDTEFVANEMGAWTPGK